MNVPKKQTWETASEQKRMKIASQQSPVCAPETNYQCTPTPIHSYTHTAKTESSSAAACHWKMLQKRKCAPRPFVGRLWSVSWRARCSVGARVACRSKKSAKESQERKRREIFHLPRTVARCRWVMFVRLESGFSRANFLVFVTKTLFVYLIEDKLYTDSTIIIHTDKNVYNFSEDISKMKKKKGGDLF